METLHTEITELNPIQKLSKDLKSAAKQLSHAEVRFLVDSYYMLQENRIRSNNQVRSLEENNEPHAVLDWLATNNESLENQIKKALDLWSNANPVGQWSRSIVGIGPVIASGLLAHIDIHKAPTVGHIWSFCGFNPKKEWTKGTKRPWNARLKTLCWKIGESFVKVSSHENDIYGKVYLQRKAFEIAQNDELKYKDQADAKLKMVGKNTEAYKHYAKGKLPLGHLHSRAKRYAVKLFLAHWHEVAYEVRFGEKPPLPYPIAILGHGHQIPVPNKM